MMPEIEYQMVDAAPVESIVELYKAGGWWLENQANRDRIHGMILGSFCFMIARSAEGRIIAMGRVISDGASDAYIQDVVVLPSHRRQGIGGEIIQRLTQHCLQHKIGWIGLVAEPGTAHFYEQLGFRILEGYQAMLFGKGE
jgi:GNAT superfamily N-acetyltransferase